LKITTLHIIAPPEAAKKDAVIHVDSDDVAQLITELEGKGCPVKLRQR
jgi:predicted nucleic acid-binding Zn finger protein